MADHWVDVGAFDQVDTSGRPEAYVEFMDRVHPLTRTAGDVELDLRPGARVLDVGCGAGHDTLVMAERVDGGGLVVGVDLSATMLAETRRRAAGVPVLLCRADAQALPFRAGAFDACALRAVLIHTPDPGQAVVEAMRVLRPGGQVLLAEPDHETHVLTTTENEVFSRVKAYRQSTFRHPLIGRRVAGLLAGAGAVEVEVSTVPILHTDYAELLARGPYDQAARDAVAAGYVTDDETDRFLRSLDAAQAEGRFLFAGLSFTAVAGKPAGDASAHTPQGSAP